MSLKYIDSNGASHVVSGMTPGGNLETGAVATRSGTITFTSIEANATGTYTVTFNDPMPDGDYEVVYDIMSGTTDGSLGKDFLTTYNKSANGFLCLLYNGDTVAKTNITFIYKAFKLYEVADAEALYSDVTDIKSYIPSNASSSNKLSTANDLRTETRSLDRRIDDLEDVVPSDAGISNKLVTQDDLSGVEIDKVEDINDVELTSIQDGQTLLWDATNSKWINGQGGKIYTAGDGISIDGTDKISARVDGVSIISSNKDLQVADTYKTTFIGTKAEWDALSTTDKKKYNVANITDDVIGGEVADSVTDGLMSPVTSNAVYDYPINSITDGEHRPPTSDAVYDAFASLRTWVDVTSSAVTITGSTFDRNTIKVYSNGDECIICGEYTDTTNPESTQDGWINGLVHLKVNANYCPRYETALFGFNNRDNHSPVIYYLSTNGKIQGYTGNGTGAGVMDRVPVNGRWIINK